jgi:hypothetical protein
MSISDQTTSRRAAFLEVEASILIFGLFFLYTWLVTGPHLIYQYQTPVFLTGMDFLERFLDKPGGLVDYGSLFLAQFDYSPWLGALIITAVAWLICLQTRSLLRTMAGAAVPPWLSYFPAVLLLMLHGQYDYRLLPSAALLVALLFVNLYLRPAWSAPRRLALFAVLSALLYAIAGGVYVLFAVLCAISELVRKRQYALGVLYILCAAALPCGFAMYSYDVGMREAFVSLHPYRPVYVNMKLGPDDEAVALRKSLNALSRMHAALMLFFPAAALLAAFHENVAGAGAALRRWLARLRAAVRPRPAPETVAEPHAPAASIPWTIPSLAVFLVLGCGLAYGTFDLNVKKRLEIEYYGERKDWEMVLATARDIGSEAYDFYVMHEVVRALYHTGKLPDEMCSWPVCVHPPSIQLTAAEMTNVGYAKFSELSLELGNVNLAQHWGHLALEIEGNSPRLLKLLVKVNVLQGRTEAARTLLGALRRNLLYREWADQCLALLGADPGMEHNREFHEIRAVMLDHDYGYGGFGGFTYDRMIGELLLTNRKNKMAFEYLMAFYLLTRQFDKVGANIGRLIDFDYAGIPRMYEEAVLLQSLLPDAQRPNLCGRSISGESISRFNRFLADLDVYQNGPEVGRKRAFETLVRKWGNSYFFFGVFGFSEPRPGWTMTGVPPMPGADK